MPKNITIKAAVVTVSDSRTYDDDKSGDAVAAGIASVNGEIIERMIVSDETVELLETLNYLAARDDMNLIVTTGGTGFGPRDNTPEATLGVIRREAPGLAEAMRRETALKTPLAILSRGVCGIRGTTLIINLPGSPKGVQECFEVLRPVLQHAIDLINGNTAHED